MAISRRNQFCFVRPKHTALKGGSGRISEPSPVVVNFPGGGFDSWDVMRHTKIPSENGWYWMGNSEESCDWTLVFVDAETSEQPAVFVHLETESYELQDFERAMLTDAIFHGPLKSPGGDMSETTVIVDERAHQEAKRFGKAIVVEHTDYTHFDNTGTVTSVRLGY